MNLYFHQNFMRAVLGALTLAASASLAQVSEIPPSTGPIIVQYPSEKSSSVQGTVQEAAKKPVKKKSARPAASNGESGTSTESGLSGKGTLPANTESRGNTSIAPRNSKVGVEESLSAGEETVQSVQRGNDAIERVNRRDGYCELCELQKQLSEGRGQEFTGLFQAKEANREGEKAPPTQDRNNSIGIRSLRCGSRDGGYDVCIFSGDVSPGLIKIVRGNRNKDPLREWQFSFENKARQDLGLMITDISAGGNQTNESYLMLFPRKFLPSIRVSGNSQVVTLPTGETVAYDLVTKKIIGGVLNEQKTYSGNGVMVRADQTGSNEARFAKGANATATISKAGKSCKVPKKDLWPDQTDSSALHFKYATDQEFNDYLQKKCGFGI